MPKLAFTRVETWIFDLDNTLYPAECRLFDQIDMRMTDFIAEALAVSAEEANQLRARYWAEHGTTLNGLMKTHGMGADAFLDYVHDIDLSGVAAAPALLEALHALPGRKVVHTNGSRGHATRVLAQLQIAEAFDAIFGIEDSGFEPKPQRVAYERVVAAGGIEPVKAAMFEDTARNLEAPFAMGMRTVWTPTGDSKAHEGSVGPHVEFVAEDLAGFLERLV